MKGVVTMDTGVDFIQPEFLNILFFQQKNLVIFPYVDLKHLHALEIFTVGYNSIDLESTALYNLKEIVEFEMSNCYSQNFSFFFIYNLNKKNLKELIDVSGIRCILNTNDNVNDLFKDDSFIFYNKKNQTFLNYDKTEGELEFERNLISSSENETILHDKIQQIKILSTKIFNEINKNPDSFEFIPDILKDFEIKYWEKILDFTRHYFNIKIPRLKFNPEKYKKKRLNESINLEEKNQETQFLIEYQFIISLNKHITNEFVQCLHQYRSRKINPRYLEIEQLYHPQKIYIYLRAHHWREEIDLEFFKSWIQMELTGYRLTKQDVHDFEKICDKFHLPKKFIANFLPLHLNDYIDSVSERDINLKHNMLDQIKVPFLEFEELPSVQKFEEFKSFYLKRLDKIEQVISKLKNLKSSSFK